MQAGGHCDIPGAAASDGRDFRERTGATGASFPLGVHVTMSTPVDMSRLVDRP